MLSYSEAADTYCLAIEIDQAGHKADLYRQLACCYERLGSYREAIRARELQVRDRADLLVQAQRCRESEDVEDEIVDTERLFLGEAWFDLGRCYLLDGDFAAAEWAFRRAIDTAGKCVRARVELGVLLRRLGRAGEAEGYLQDALALATAKVEENQHSAPRIAIWHLCIAQLGGPRQPTQPGPRSRRAARFTPGRSRAAWSC